MTQPHRLPLSGRAMAGLVGLALALVLTLCLGLAGCGEEPKVLSVYNWTEYLPESVIADFEKETGIDVQYSTYDSNEAMYAKLVSLDGKGYDVVFPSTYFVQRMRLDGLLQPIDKTKLPNLKNLDPELLDKPYDPGNQYSVPYLWGTTGIAVNPELADPASITSWKDLWNPELKDKLLLTDDIREVFGMALKVLGYSINDTDPAHIEAAYQLLTELLPNVRVFAADSPSSVLLAREVAVAQIWNGEAYLANTEGDAEFPYIYPSEGVNVWMDNMVIPKGAEHVEAAHAFIDFLLRPEIAARVCEEFGYTTPNLAAIPLLPEELRTNTILFPTKEDMQNAEFMEYIGDAVVIYEQYWEKLKTGK